MQKYIRELSKRANKLANDLGVDFVGVGHGKHLKLFFECDGQKQYVTCAKTPSCNHNLKNVDSGIRNVISKLLVLASNDR